MSANERVPVPTPSIRQYLDSHSNIEDWSVLYESNKSLPIKIQVKLWSYIYDDYRQIYDHIYGLGFSNIEVSEIRTRY
jgi:hypothetical protein